MTQGIRRYRTTKDGKRHVWYRYPVTDIFGGEYCPICLQKSIAQDCHHVVSRIETRQELGYEQHWHNNIINICTLCHERTTRQLEDSELICRRILYFMSAVHGFRTWFNRDCLKKVCDNFSKSGSAGFIDFVINHDNILRMMAIAHYHASFGKEYLKKINEKNPLFFLDQQELITFNCKLPQDIILDAEATKRLSTLFLKIE